VILLVSFSLVFSMVQTGSALTTYYGSTVNWMNIYITHAYYYDMDSDGVKDDVLLDFTCYVKDYIPTPSWSYFEIYLTLPSGLTYYVTFEVIGRYRVLAMSMIWYNCATEAGWYNIEINSYTTFYGLIGFSWSDIDFDPPVQGGTGEPHVYIFM